MNNDVFRIVVCIKPIKSELISQNGSQINEPYQINPYDLMALENLVSIKKELKSKFIITCLCMGPKKAETALKKAFAIGADEVFLLNDSVFIGSDTVATSYIMSMAIKNNLDNVKMIVCGEKSIDGETGQIPIGLSERLNFKSSVNASKIIDVSENFVVYKQKQGTNIFTQKSKLPLVMTFSEFKTTPPTISLLALKRSKNKSINILDNNDLKLDVFDCGLKGSKTKVLEVQNEFSKKNSKSVEGNIEDKANLILELVCGKITI